RSNDHVYCSLRSIPLTCFPHPCTVPLLSLHSFPTRRSSDLVQRAVVCVVAQVRDDERVVRQRAVRQVRRELRTARCRTTRSSSRDRKSTRLNSSHVAISYAVFCLKKKNTK